MEYIPWAKINMSRKERQKLIDAPVPSYNKESVDKAIQSSNQFGKKIGSKESKAIHALLKGRYAKGGKINTAEHKNSKCRDW